MNNMSCVVPNPDELSRTCTFSVTLNTGVDDCILLLFVHQKFHQNIRKIFYYQAYGKVNTLKGMKKTCVLFTGLLASPYISTLRQFHLYRFVGWKRIYLAETDTGNLCWSTILLPPCLLNSYQTNSFDVVSGK